jgi:hypothetical protein
MVFEAQSFKKKVKFDEEAAADTTPNFEFKSEQ